MSKSQNRKAAFLVLAAISLSLLGLAGPAAGAQTLDITGLRISPNPGYACDNTTISFNVTNNLGTMVDLVTVNVAAKSAVGGMSWQSNITLFANGATSFQSFVWTNPPEGIYDVSITVIGAGQIAQKSGVYTVLPCAAHVYIGHVTIVKSALALDSATVTAEVGNDGHAPAYNTTVAVQATGPLPGNGQYFLGSTLIPLIDAGETGHPAFTWAPIPPPGVYNFTVIAIDENGVVSTGESSLVIDLRPHPNVVQILGISIDPYPPVQGQDGNVTVELLFSGNWTGVPVEVLAYADGPASYFLGNETLTSPDAGIRVKVRFPWLSDIEPGQYDITVTAVQFNPKEYTISKLTVTQMAKQKAFLPSNFRLDIKGLRLSPYPPLPGQNSTVTVEVANTGDADAPPAKLTVTAEGPAFYNLGTRTTPSTSFGSMVRLDFSWPQPVAPGEYTIRAFLEDAGGNQSELRKTFPMPHVLESNLSVVNGSAVYNYYYYGAAPNGSQGQNITVIVPTKLNETEAAATGLDTVTTGAIVGIAIGSVVSVASMAAYMLGKHKGQMGTVQSNPMYQDRPNAGQNPMYQDKGMAGESPLHIHERMVHGVHRGEGVDEPQEASLVGGALPGGAVISSAVSSGIRESPTRPSTGQTSIRESPTLPSTGAASDGSTNQWPTMVRESPTLPSKGQTSIRESPTRATAVTDADGYASPDARMAVNTKGLPGKSSTKKENEAAAAHQRATGGGEELPKESVDYGGVPPEPDQSSNPIPGVGIVVKRAADYGSAVRESPSRPSTGQTSIRESPTLPSTGPTSAKQSKVAAVGRVETPLGLQGTRESPTLPSKGVTAIGDLDGDGTPDSLTKKGYDYYQAQSQLNSAGKERESPTRATAVSTRDSVSSVAQTAGSGGEDRPTESLDQSRKGWDGTIKGVKVDEDPSASRINKGWDGTIKGVKVDEDPSASRINKGWDGTIKGVKVDEGSPEAASKKGYDYYQAQSQLNPAGKVRESPTRASAVSTRDSVSSVAQTAGSSPAGEPMGIRESPTRASGLRESPTQASDFAIKEQGVRAPESGEGDASQAAKAAAGKKELTGHVTLIK